MSWLPRHYVGEWRCHLTLQLRMDQASILTVQPLTVTGQETRVFLRHLIYGDGTC
jgi:hypothetical protein